MTDQEAYELMVKYSGNDGIARLQDMIHRVGVESTIDKVIEVYEGETKSIEPEFRNWMRQAINYLHKKNQNVN